MFALALLLLWPIVEVYLVVRVADAVGVGLTILLLVASWPVGSWLIRNRVRRIWRRGLAALAAGRAPGTGALDGSLLLLAGGLLMVPGFLTDVAAGMLLLPPGRALARRTVERHRHTRFVRSAAQFAGGAPAYDVDVTAHDFDSPRLPR